MKRFYLILTLVCFMVLPELQPEAIAQRDRQERVTAHRAAMRKVKRRTRRKVRRRVTRRAHLKYARLPRYTTIITAVPAGAMAITKNRVTYYHYRGVFYKPVAGKYVALRPPNGIRVSIIPANSISIVLPAGNFHYYHGIYYARKGQKYEVVDAPSGALIDGIPEGYEVVTWSGHEYYRWDGHLYQEVETDEFREGVGYEVVATDRTGFSRG